MLLSTIGTVDVNLIVLLSSLHTFMVRESAPLPLSLPLPLWLLCSAWHFCQYDLPIITSIVCI